MYVTTDHLVKLGISREIIDHKITSGEWQAREIGETTDVPEKEVLISSLPEELQIKWAQQYSLPEYPEQIAVLLSEASEHGVNEQVDEITKRLTSLAPAERFAWMKEALRVAKIIERYGQIRPKRRRNSVTGVWEFVEGIEDLCEEIACKDQAILSRHPHRRSALSPHTMDQLYRDYLKCGLLAFLPKVNREADPARDKRRAAISREAVQWVNKHWRRFSGPRFLYNALEKEANKHGWKIPSESWLYRRWKGRPEIVKTSHAGGKKSYVSKYEPYVPRDYSDLRALQILCGDHSRRDVTVSLPGGKIMRPWLTV